MKRALQSLFQRPSSWLSLLSAALLVFVLVSPGLRKNDNRQARGMVPEKEVEMGSAPAVVSTDQTGKPTDGESPKTDAVVSSRQQKGPSTMVIPPVESPPLQPKVDMSSPTEKLEKSNVAGQSHADKTPQMPRALVSERKADTQKNQETNVEVAGPPSLEELSKRLEFVVMGPPAPTELTKQVLLKMVGPPSPAEIGPPLAAMSDEARALLAEAAKSDAKATGADGGKLADGKGSVSRPTTRITPPAASPKDSQGSKDEMDGDGHKTGPVPDDDQQMAARQKQPEPPPLSEEPLPPATGNVWKIVNIDGRDYVTGDSIQLFYRFSTHKVDGKHVWFRNPNLIIKGQIGSQELLVNNIKFILSYPVLSQGGKALFSRLDLCKLIEPVIRPSYIGSSSVFDTVVLDAGHGGHDAGARGVYGYEKNYALAMVLAVRDALVKKGFKVVLTRSNDTFLSLSSRVAVANRTPNSIFISVHFNSGGSAASGIETFALTPQGSASSLARGGGFSNTARTGNQFDSENIALATAVHAQVVHRFKLIDRGIKRARWSVLSACQRPGILFEGGFVTNARECQLIASDSYRKAVAQAIADAVTNYRTALAPRPAKR